MQSVVKKSCFLLCLGLFYSPASASPVGAVTNDRANESQVSTTHNIPPQTLAKVCPSVRYHHPETSVQVRSSSTSQKQKRVQAIPPAPYTMLFTGHSRNLLLMADQAGADALCQGRDSQIGILTAQTAFMYWQRVEGSIPFRATFSDHAFQQMWQSLLDPSMLGSPASPQQQAAECPTGPNVLVQWINNKDGPWRTKKSDKPMASLPQYLSLAGLVKRSS
jgi:hypothetical protein